MCAEMLSSFLQRITGNALLDGCLEAFEHGRDTAQLFVYVFEILNVLALLVNIYHLLELLTIIIVRTLLRPMLIAHLKRHKC